MRLLSNARSAGGRCFSHSHAPSRMSSPTQPAPSSPTLIRGMGLGSATALNMIDMIGVGPFITMPLVVAAMGGPQAILGWVAGALLAVCDGLVSAELGAALPASGGTYRYLREMYGPEKWGRLISFLFIWQVSFSAPLSIATG
jgi:basic amino acid/polyamine antiporter, APA family